MSKSNNVNPGQYKVAGRERQGEEINHEAEDQKFGTAEAETPKEGDRNFIPGAAPVGVSEKDKKK